MGVRLNASALRQQRRRTRASDCLCAAPSGDAWSAKTRHKTRADDAPPMRASSHAGHPAPGTPDRAPLERYVVTVESLTRRPGHGARRRLSLARDVECLADIGHLFGTRDHRAPVARGHARRRVARFATGRSRRRALTAPCPRSPVDWARHRRRAGRSCTARPAPALTVGARRYVGPSSPGKRQVAAGRASPEALTTGLARRWFPALLASGRERAFRSPGGRSQALLGPLRERLGGQSAAPYVAP